jgi:hypothetical protein
MGIDETLHYRAARTVVNISGTVTVRTLDDGRKGAERVGDVTVATEADPHRELELVIEDQFGRDHEFELKLAADARLTGAGYATTGVGTQILEAGLRLATIAAKLAPAALMGLIPEEVAREELAVESVLEKEKRDLFERRKRFRTVVGDLQSAVADESADAAAKGSEPDALQRLRTLQRALALARAEAALLETQFDKWRASRFPDWTQKLVYAIGTDELPRRELVEQELVLADGENRGDVREAAQNLGIVVARIESESQPTRSPDKTAIWYRYPRRVQLATFAQDAESEGGVYRLRDLTHAWIVDSQSEWRDVPIRSGLFKEHGATVEFGDAGTLTHLTNKEVGAGAVAKALIGAGSEVEESLDEAAKIRAALQPADATLTVLQDQVMRKELEARLAEATHKVASADTAQ